MIILLASCLLLGPLLAVMMWQFDVEKRFGISPILMIVSPPVIAVLTIFLTLAGADGGEILPAYNFVDIVFFSILTPFLLSLSVVWLYRIKSIPYVIVTTLTNGVYLPVFIVLLQLMPLKDWATPGQILFLLVFLGWHLLFAGYTAYYLHAYDLPSDNNDHDNRKKEDMSESERFMAKRTKTGEELGMDS